MQILILAEDNQKYQKLFKNKTNNWQSQISGQGKLITEQSEKLKQLNQELTEIKRNELELTNQKIQNTEQIDSLTIKLKEQEQQYQQLQDQLQKKIKELNQSIQNTQSNLAQTNQQLQSKDQELKNTQFKHDALLEELKSAYSFVTIQWTIGINKLLKDDHFNKILKNIEVKTNKKVKNQYFIFSGENNDLNGQAFWKSVDKLSNLLMIFKSKSGNIFGAFSPCQWIANCSGGYIYENTLSSFIFSQTQDQIQIFPIKEGNKCNAIYCNQSYGPTFGGGHDFYIQQDFQNGSSSLGHSYSYDQYQVGNRSTHLFGQSSPNIAECEIFMLTFA
ncbi:unnamed protein product (macronuclear) [Paramecium tetraurelia]|uniref:TLDc domain-containing protein n=1 Tax=Paramecium tetraurelia TaxID=5888 RepID=A0E275_PARTE|nr:uncharacterized protein GSPATT00022564001 [Paramecium tetraurelia]CAK89392.1 unnamed protein product [Paramecium tetraurelia]|eukprot:XP_001456789.1 hypothetical protein (macronuclear) [Paramecium tetraurelia strain d4-2]